MPSFMNAALAVAKVRYYAERLSFSHRWSTQQKDQLYLKCWTEAAKEVEASIEAGHRNLLRITKGNATTVVWRNYTDLDGPATLRAVGDKRYVQRALAREQIPTPSSFTFQLSDLSEASRFLAEHGTCVVKPLSGTGGGSGITTRICSQRELRIASKKASGYCRDLQIEQYIEGCNFRLLFLDGVLIDAVERQPPSVTGDGYSRLSRLVLNENRSRKKQGFQHAQELLDIDEDMAATLKSKRLTLRSVIPAGESVSVKTVINQNAASENRSALAELSPHIVQTARQAVQCLNVRLAGVDVLTPDPTQDLQAVGGVVLEVNTTPGFYCHQHLGSQGVAVPILKACLSDASRRLRAMGERSPDASDHFVEGLSHVD